MLKPGDAIRGYGNEGHKTETTAGLFSFGVAQVSPPAGAPPGQIFKTSSEIYNTRVFDESDL